MACHQCLVAAQIYDWIKYRYKFSPSSPIPEWFGGRSVEHDIHDILSFVKGQLADNLSNKF